MKTDEELLLDKWDEWFDGAVIEPTLKEFLLDLIAYARKA